jgi:hypothetical protein
MRRFAGLGLMLVATVVPSFGKVHKDEYSVACGTLWSAVKETLRTSGKYQIVSLENADMSASYTMGIGSVGQKRINSVTLSEKEKGCEMAVTSGFSGLTNDDAGDFKKRVEATLDRQKSSAPAAAPASPDSTSK